MSNDLSKFGLLLYNLLLAKQTTAHLCVCVTKQGAKILCGGVRVRTDDKSLAGGFYMSPCVLTNVKDDMLIAREEVFGPVACVFPFDSEDEVLRRANDSPYGLAAGVFTKLVSVVSFSVIFYSCVTLKLL